MQEVARTPPAFAGHRVDGAWLNAVPTAHIFDKG